MIYKCIIEYIVYKYQSPNTILYYFFKFLNSPHQGSSLDPLENSQYPYQIPSCLLGLPSRPANNGENKIPSDILKNSASIFVWKFRLTVFQNHHLNTIRTRYFWRVKVGYDLFNQHGCCKNILQFQIHSRFILEGKKVKRYLSHQD